MADTLVDRVLGRDGTTGEASPDRARDISVQLVMTDASLFAGDSEPAELPGYGPIPAPLARSLAANAIEATVDGRSRAFVRRLYTDSDGQLIAMDSRARCFPDGLARLIRARDQVCRSPWCGAPIRHIDHIEPVEHGGLTTVQNGQGLCERCNYTKSLPGWRASAEPDGSVSITTPTGQRFASRPPPLPGAA